MSADTARATPGPWTVSGRWILDDGGKTVALVRKIGRTPSQIAALVFLIAAAPELRDALRELVEAAGNPTPEALKRAEAVLAKASGEDR